jgi:hypothetical protein
MMELIVRLAACVLLVVLLARFAAWAARRYLRIALSRNAATG